MNPLEDQLWVVLTTHYCESHWGKVSLETKVTGPYNYLEARKRKLYLDDDGANATIARLDYVDPNKVHPSYDEGEQ